MLAAIAWISMGVSFVCALVIVIDETRKPQAMGVMNIVWPVTALYGSVFALWAYFTLGRRETRQAMHAMGGMSSTKEAAQQPPTFAQVGVGTSHCGAGCMLADIVTEFGIAGTSLTLFGSVLWSEYILDFAAAWALGIVFQYFAIQPMRKNLSAGGAVWAAIKADTLSILAFQVGMYAFMALVFIKLFPAPHHLTPFDARYWLMMQIAMICGYLTAFPMNRLLIGLGLKEKM